MAADAAPDAAAAAAAAPEAALPAAAAAADEAPAPAAAAEAAPPTAAAAAEQNNTLAQSSADRLKPVAPDKNQASKGDQTRLLIADRTILNYPTLLEVAHA